MSWAYHGVNAETDQEMGYTVQAICAEPGCSAQINRGKAHLCGDEHADGESCNLYYCRQHLFYADKHTQRCERCFDREGKDNG
jgi:hypothetical protein